VRSWIVIPAAGAACGGAALALGISPAVALVGAAFAAAIRMLSGDAPAAVVAAVIAPVVAVAAFAEAGGDLTRAAIALAGAGWTVAELARPAEAQVSPLVAVLPATVAAALDPSFAALIAIAGARLVTAPWQRPRWVVVVPAAGALAIALALAAGTRWASLGALWFGGAAEPIAPGLLAVRIAEALGPLTAVAALAGLAQVAIAALRVRPRYGELAVAAAAVGAALVDLRAGAPGGATLGLAALLTGLAIGRFAALIRIPAGQALIGATAGLLVALPPAWIAIERQSTAHIAHTGRASR
jgi:hypothetical protein